MRVDLAVAAEAGADRKRSQDSEDGPARKVRTQGRTHTRVSCCRILLPCHAAGTSLGPNSGEQPVHASPNMACAASLIMWPPTYSTTGRAPAAGEEDETGHPAVRRAGRERGGL